MIDKENEITIDESEVNADLSNDNSESSEDSITQEPSVEKSSNDINISKQEFNKFKEMERKFKSLQEQKAANNIQPAPKQEKESIDIEALIEQAVSKSIAMSKAQDNKYSIIRESVNKIASDNDITETNLTNELYKQINQEDIEDVLKLNPNRREAYIKEILLKDSINTIVENKKEFGNTQGLFTSKSSSQDWLSKEFGSKIKSKKDLLKKAEQDKQSLEMDKFLSKKFPNISKKNK